MGNKSVYYRSDLNAIMLHFSSKRLNLMHYLWQVQKIIRKIKMFSILLIKYDNIIYKFQHLFETKKHSSGKIVWLWPFQLLKLLANNKNAIDEKLNYSQAIRISLVVFYFKEMDFSAIVLTSDR